MSTMLETATVPFRTELRTFSSDTLSIDDAYRLQSILDNVSFEEAAQHPDEIVAWLIGQRLRAEPSEYPPDYQRRVSQRFRDVAPLVDRALRDADNEGLIWTPLLDVLAQSLDWAYLAKERVTRADGSCFPDPQKRASGLWEWIRTRKYPQELESLLAYRSDAVRCVLAAEARVFNRPIVDHIIASARSAALAFENKAAPGNLRSRALFAAYDRWREAILSAHARETFKDSIPYGILALDDIALLTTNAPAGLPGGLRKRLDEDFRGRLPYRDPLCAILVQDPNTPRDVLEDIAASTTLDIIPDILLHPNSDGALVAGVIEDEFDPNPIVLAVLRDPRSRVKGDVLLNMLPESCSLDFETVEKIVIHPAATSHVWRKVLRQYRDKAILCALAKHPPARRDPVVNSQLIATQNHAVLKAMLTDATPEEYAKYFSCIAQISIDEAISALRQTPPPEGTVFPEEMIVRLLRAQSAEDRLTVITQIVGRYDSGVVSLPSETRSLRHG